VDAARASAREKLGAKHPAAAFAAGRSMDFEQSVLLAGEECARTQPAQHLAERRSEQTSGLTRQELEIAALVAVGMTNRDVAARLFLSQRTVGEGGAGGCKRARKVSLRSAP